MIYWYIGITTNEEFDIESIEYKYFTEIGKENKDGSITGSVYELTSNPYLDGQGYKRRNCKKIGIFKIDNQGFIVRFPGLSKRLWGVAEIAMIENIDRIYG